jgi:hypothetical protein
MLTNWADQLEQDGYGSITKVVLDSEIFTQMVGAAHRSHLFDT